MSAFNNSFAGRHVTIVSSVGGSQERTDTGTLVAMTDAWIQLAKDNGEVLLFPHSAIRVVKLLDVEPALSVAKQDFLAEPAVPPAPDDTLTG